MWFLVTQAPRVWHHDGHFMGLHWLGWLFWILVTVLLVLAVGRLLVGERPGDRKEAEREDPADILRRRFSEGEIDEDEFRRRMRVLREAGSSDAERGGRE